MKADGKHIQPANIGAHAGSGGMVDGRMCEEGVALLARFAQARPVDCRFIEPADLTDVRSSAFSGIPEWDAFADHRSRCLRCASSADSGMTRCSGVGGVLRHFWEPKEPRVCGIAWSCATT
jgi:hypothetical protein